MDSPVGQAERTLNWIDFNYEFVDSICIPRCVLYQHYLQFCQSNQFSPVGPATFGKIIRQRFPKVTTRRLGTRGQSIYHYCGIGIKENSMFYKQVYKTKKLSRFVKFRFSGVKVKNETSGKKYSLNCKIGTVLPDIPDVSDFVLPDEINREKVITMMLMYKTHLQRVLDLVTAANFDQVNNFLHHFWTSVPSHLTSVLDTQVLLDFVSYSDLVLYRVINDVLIPPTIQEVPDSLCSEIKSFLSMYPTWIEECLMNVPTTLKNIKLTRAKQFTKDLIKQLTFLHLAQTVREFLNNNDVTRHIYNELKTIDMDAIGVQLNSLSSIKSPSCQLLIKKYLLIFLDHFDRQFGLEQLIERVDQLMDACVVQDVVSSVDFLLSWSYFSFMVIKDLTLKSSKSFGAFHLLHLMFDEYIQLVLEGLQINELEKKAREKLNKYLSMEPAISQP